MNTNTQVRIIISHYGNGIAVGIEGEREAIERAFNRFYNFGNGNPSLHEMSERFSYFVTTEEDLIHALETERVTYWQNTANSLPFKSKERSKRGEAGKRFLSAVHDDALAEFNSFERDNFMSMNETPAHVYHVASLN